MTVLKYELEVNLRIEFKTAHGISKLVPQFNVCLKKPRIFQINIFKNHVLQKNEYKKSSLKKNLTNKNEKENVFTKY